MSDQPTSDTKPAVCDGTDRGVTPERLGQLRVDADAFNRTLQDSQQHHDEPRAFDASKAFYVQLTQLPIGERRALAVLAQEQNKTLTAKDDAMPILEINMDSHAFINDVTVKYPWLRARDINTNEMGWAREYFKFQYRGMCAEYKPGNYETHGSGFSVEISPIGSPLHRHR